MLIVLKWGGESKGAVLKWGGESKGAVLKWGGESKGVVLKWGGASMRRMKSGAVSLKGADEKWGGESVTPPYGVGCSGMPVTFIRP